MTLAAAQHRIEELLKVGVITKLANPNGNEYRISDVVPLMFGAEDDPEGWELEKVEINLASVSENRWCTSSDPHIKRRKELKEKTTDQSVATVPAPVKSGSVVVNFAINEKPTESGSKRVSEGTYEQPTQEQKPGHEEKTLPFTAEVGSKNSRQFVERFGLERCQEVWDKAQTARNAGGYMRRALEENWVWTEKSSKSNGVPEPSRPYLIDHAKSTARAAQLAGIDLDTSSEPSSIDPNWVANMRKLVRSGVVRY